ncbi:MAG: ligase-associated DNA damage response DEXH box helicase, partial [Chloroflexota bacterium]
MTASNQAHSLAPIDNWFEAQGWTPFPFQSQVWEAYLAGESGLIHSPTGTGKTYAAWMGPLAEWIGEQEVWPPPQKKSTKSPKRKKNTPPIRVLWITPLRALAADTTVSLNEAADALGINWSIESRTGTTSSSVRSRQRKKLPTTLVTTPESLSLMLTWPDAQALFADLRCVIVDEWHEFMSSKRGIQVELALARLRRWSPNLRTWGLSATIGNLETALDVLVGRQETDRATFKTNSGRLIEGDLTKILSIESIIPERMGLFPWAGHLGLHLLSDVVEQVKQHQTSLIFCNTRNQVEQWYQALIEYPDVYPLALHHSAIEQEKRAWVEDGLRAGTIKCVVCTSSLDLGVDFPAVDAVFQVSSPKGIARLMQRAGRSGHQPGAESKVMCVPGHAFELIEISAARMGMESGQLESRQPIDTPLDVLTQHLVTIGLGGGFDRAELLSEVRSAYSFQNLTVEQWDWALAFVSSGGDAFKAYEQYHRLQLEDNRYATDKPQIARQHRMSIGTIVGDAPLEVRYQTGGRIGQIEESFASRLNKGDRFTLAGKILEFIRIKDLKVFVKRAKSGRKGIVPRWMGGRLPLTESLTAFMRQRIDEAEQEIFADEEMAALRPIFNIQRFLSRIPRQNEMLIEMLKSREGYHYFFYPFSGRLVHEGLSALVAYRLARETPLTFTIAASDYGFELLSSEKVELNQEIAARVFSPDNLIKDIEASLNASEMARRQFRVIARVSGLVYDRYPGGNRSMRQMQASSSLIYNVLENYDPENLLLVQARQEVLRQQLEVSRLTKTLERITAGEILTVNIHRATPFAFPLLADRMRQTFSSETVEDRIQKMVAQLE